MPQSFLGVNPGTTIKDELAATLLNDEEVDGATVTGDWIEVNFPGEVVAELKLGDMAASTVLTVEIQGSDTGESGGTNVVSYGGFDSMGEDDDGQTRFRDLQIYKRWVRAVAIESAGDADSVTVKLRPKTFGLTNTRTA